MNIQQLETQQVSIRMPKFLLAAIDRERKGFKVSRSQAIISALRQSYKQSYNEENYDYYPYTDESKQVLRADFQESLRQVKAGEVSGTLEQLITELKADNLTK